MGDLDDRVAALELAVRSLSRQELARFGDAVREASTEVHQWAPSERFWFDGTAGLKLHAQEDNAVRELWTRMNAALLYVVSGDDVEPDRDRPEIEGQAATVLEKALGGDVWLGVIGIWNALCADLFRDRLEPSMHSDLGASWRKVRAAGPSE